MSLKPSLPHPFQEVIPGVLRYNGDCCAVYVLHEGDQGILIDLGSGSVLDDLHQVGVRVVQGVYITHAHRDQCQGAGRLAALGIPIHMPESARSLVDVACRRDFQLPTPLLKSYPGDFFEPPHPIPYAQYDVRPGQSLHVGPCRLDVVPAPGHCNHQVAYVYRTQRHHVVFCGDAVHSAGKVHEGYHLETDHYTGAGARMASDTLRSLRLLCPNVVCPSHGPVYQGNSWDFFLATELALENLGRMKDSIFPGCGPDRRLLNPWEPGLVQITDHLWQWLNSFFLLSEQGGALMVDCGIPFGPELWRRFGEVTHGRNVEAVLISHIHCDHLDQIGNLQRAFPRAEVWSHRSLVPIVERPHAFRRPWLAPSPVKVDRAVGEAESVRWHEYTITAYFFPAQTDFHACFETRVDGKHVLFTGDNFYPSQQWGGTGGLCGLNGGHPRKGWRRSIQLVMDIAPDWILCSHTHCFEYKREHFERALEWTEAVARQMEDVSPDGNLDRHHNPHFTSLFPYIQAGTSGEGLMIRAILQNPYAQAREVSIALVCPEDWDADPVQESLLLPAEGHEDVEFWIRPAASAVGRYMLTVDVVYHGEYLGEKAECYVDLNGGGEG